MFGGGERGDPCLDRGVEADGEWWNVNNAKIDIFIYLFAGFFAFLSASFIFIVKSTACGRSVYLIIGC